MTNGNTHITSGIMIQLMEKCSYTHTYGTLARHSTCAYSFSHIHMWAHTYRYVQSSTLSCTCRDVTHSCTNTQFMHTYKYMHILADINTDTWIHMLHCTVHEHRQTHFYIHHFILSYTQTYTHAFIALSGVWQSCHHQRPGGGGGGGAVGGRGWGGGGLCYAKWWLAIAIATGEGQSQRLVGEELQADYKTLWAAVSPLLSCLHCISHSTLSLSCYLAGEVARSAPCGGRREGGSLSCQRDSWTGRSIYPLFLPSHISPSPWQSCLHLVDLSVCEWHLGRQG